MTFPSGSLASQHLAQALPPPDCAMLPTLLRWPLSAKAVRLPASKHSWVFPRWLRLSVSNHVFHALDLETEDRENLWEGS